MLKREDYRKIKGMNREQMDAYLQRIYISGYKAGSNKMTVHKDSNSSEPDKADEKQ